DCVEGAVDRAVALPRLVVVLLHVGRGKLAGLSDRAGVLRAERLEQAWLRDIGDIGGVAGPDADRELLLEGAAAFVVDGRAGALLERYVAVDVRLVLGGDDRGEDRDGRAFQVAVGLECGTVD